MARLSNEEAQAVERATLQLSGQAWGVSVGLLCGVGLFVATLILVLKGGVNVGQHLGLLSVYLPGYRVTVLGAFIGFIYLFVIGYALGRLIGLVYNSIAKPAH
ncbi:MAG TPA: hypothetical protein VJR92_04075 [Gemmatimonadaceae bacterium]|nr:hypothetical protein [Gemmatimonadaceae bacterium]